MITTRKVLHSKPAYMNVGPKPNSNRDVVQVATLAGPESTKELRKHRRAPTTTKMHSSWKVIKHHLSQWCSNRGQQGPLEWPAKQFSLGRKL